MISLDREGFPPRKTRKAKPLEVYECHIPHINIDRCDYLSYQKKNLENSAPTYFLEKNLENYEK